MTAATADLSPSFDEDAFVTFFHVYTAHIFLIFEALAIAVPKQLIVTLTALARYRAIFPQTSPYL